MKLSRLFTLLLVLLTTLSCGVNAEEKVRKLKVGLFEISTLLSANENALGPYNTILKEFDGLETYFANPARVDLLFAQKKIDCLFPASTVGMGKEQDYISSNTINRTHAYIFAMKPYSSLDEFKGKVLAIRRGLSIGRIRGRFEASYANIASDTAMIRFLHKSRADGMIAYLVDSVAAYKSLGLSLDYYNESLPIHTSEDAFVCHKSAFTQTKINGFNQTIETLRATGKLQKIMSKTL